MSFVVALRYAPEQRGESGFTLYLAKAPADGDKDIDTTKEIDDAVSFEIEHEAEHARDRALDIGDYLLYAGEIEAVYVL